MRIWIEKEERWNKPNIYFIMSDNECIAIAYSDEDATAQFDKAVASYHPSTKTVLKEVIIESI